MSYSHTEEEMLEMFSPNLVKSYYKASKDLYGENSELLGKDLDRSENGDFTPCMLSEDSGTVMMHVNLGFFVDARKYEKDYNGFHKLFHYNGLIADGYTHANIDVLD